ncbi:MAG: hypothetical protein SFY56_11345 [Bacteroidota bacterium]|nr:hypothetical protein [Bacteroidota bacterium]
MRYFIFLLPFVVFVCSCVKDKPKNPVQPIAQLSTAKKVYVVNEGNYGSANSSISLIDLGNNQVVEDFFKNQNNSVLGDVTQSINYFNSNFYIVVNNSGKIVVCNNQFKKMGQISGLTSPRYILPITNQKAYVSDLYSNAISVVDLNTNTKISSIPCSGWTEKMTLIYDKAFITNLKTNFVYVVNTFSNVITDSINVGKNAGSIGIDKYDKLWVLSVGDKTNSILGKLCRINPATNQVELSLSFTLNDSPNNLCFNKTKDTLYYLNDGVYRMSISSSSLPQTPIIAQGNKNFYGLGINPNDYTIYASDALDYIQKSNIYVYDINGNLKQNFKAGLISNGFYFE